MKTTYLLGLLIAATLIFTSCGESKKQEQFQTETPEQTAEIVKPVVLDTNLDKYIGCYKRKTDPSASYSIGKIPGNCVVRYSDLKFFPLDSKYIGKYFLVQYCFGLNVAQSTSEHGYHLPEHMYMGSFLDGVGENGNMQITSYSVRETGLEVSTPQFYGVLVKNEAGEYCIRMNNAEYVLTK